MNKDIDDKLELLKSYIHILNNSDDDYELAKTYFIIQQINKFLNLKKLNNASEVYNKFLELYDINHKVRNNVETFDNIESVRQYLSKRQEVLNRITENK